MFINRLLENGAGVYFHPEQAEAAELIASAVTNACDLMQSRLGLPQPVGLRVYVMTSWTEFVFHASPWIWKVINALTFPILYPRGQKAWKISNGWSLPYKHRPAVGIKPPELHRMSSQHRNLEYFDLPKDADQGVQQTTCHELVHAFTTHLRLPGWLNEGLAVRMTDHFAGQPTIKDASLQVILDASKKKALGQYRSLTAQDMDTLLYIYLRGYWIVRLLEETQPSLFKGIFSPPKKSAEYETQISTSLGIAPDAFWDEVDQQIAQHYSGRIRE